MPVFQYEDFKKNCLLTCKYFREEIADFWMVYLKFGREVWK